MNTRVLTGHKLVPPPSSQAPLEPENPDPAPKHTRRRRHTLDNQQDRLLRTFSRILIILGILMVLWLMLRALGWV